MDSVEHDGQIAQEFHACTGSLNLQSALQWSNCQLCVYLLSQNSFLSYSQNSFLSCKELNSWVSLCLWKVWLWSTGAQNSIFHNERPRSFDHWQVIQPSAVCCGQQYLQCGKNRQLWVHRSCGWHCDQKTGMTLVMKYQSFAAVIFSLTALFSQSASKPLCLFIGWCFLCSDRYHISYLRLARSG